jgi:hypothetical protein
MAGRIHGWLPRLGLVMGLVIIFGLAGCETTKQTLGIGESAPVAPRYYDFPDVLVPPELSLEQKGSFIYEHGATKAGILFFTGRAEVESLVDFFRKSMARDGWTLVNSVKFNRILLNFAKADRNCQIVIWDKSMSTEVEVWVHPLRPAGA